MENHGKEYEVVAHYDNDKVVAKVWWDGKRVQSDNERILQHLVKSAHTDPNSEDFFKEVRQHLRSGYVSLRRV